MLDIIIGILVLILFTVALSGAYLLACKRQATCLRYRKEFTKLTQANAGEYR